MAKRRLEINKYENSANGIRNWPKIQNPLKVAANVTLLTIAKFLPLKIKNKVIRLTGLQIKDSASIGFGVVFDIIVPEKISVGANNTIGYGATILAHEATQDELRTGKVEIGDNVLIGANSTVLPGVKIGDNATISANSLVNRDVEEGEFVGGVPIETIEVEDKS